MVPPCKPNKDLTPKVFLTMIPVRSHTKTHTHKCVKVPLTLIFQYPVRVEINYDGSSKGFTNRTTCEANPHKLSRVRNRLELKWGK